MDLLSSLGLVGSLFGGRQQSKSAGKAANAQLQAAREALALQEKMYNQSRTDQMPWLNVGRGGLTELAALFGLDANGNPTNKPIDYSKFMNLPDYQFALQEGTKNLDRSAAARGALYSGGYGQDLTKYSQGLASQNFNNYRNGLAGLAGVGQTASQSLSSLWQNYANQGGNYLMAAGDARANGYANQGNMWGNMGNQLGMLAGYGWGNNRSSGASGWNGQQIPGMLPGWGNSYGGSNYGYNWW